VLASLIAAIITRNMVPWSVYKLARCMVSSRRQALGWQVICRGGGGEDEHARRGCCMCLWMAAWVSVRQPPAPMCWRACAR
jgi:hypothetical protein